MTKKMYQGLMIGFGSLLLVASFADLNVSLMLYNPESLYGKIFEVVGEFPAMFIACVCLGGIILTTTKNKFYYLKTIPLFALMLMFGFMGAYMISHYLNISSMGFTVVLLSIIVVGATLAAFYLKNRDANNFRKICLCGIWSFVTVLIAFNLIKIGCGRERMRHMLDPVNQFTPWYLIQGFSIDNEFMSFPSGHSANATLMLLITYLPLCVNKFKVKPLFIFSIIWILFVTTSRIVVGAHFMSDVIVGTMLSASLIYFWSIKFKLHSNNIS